MYRLLNDLRRLSDVNGLFDYLRRLSDMNCLRGKGNVDRLLHNLRRLRDVNGLLDHLGRKCVDLLLRFCDMYCLLHHLRGLSDVYGLFYRRRDMNRHVYGYFFVDSLDLVYCRRNRNVDCFHFSWQRDVYRLVNCCRNMNGLVDGVHNRLSLGRLALLLGWRRCRRVGGCQSRQREP